MVTARKVTNIDSTTVEHTALHVLIIKKLLALYIVYNIIELSRTQRWVCIPS